MNEREKSLVEISGKILCAMISNSDYDLYNNEYAEAAVRRAESLIDELEKKVDFDV